LTEYEILDLISSNTSDMATMFGIYMIVVSAYLVVAYFAGHKLSLLESVALTLLFFRCRRADSWYKQFTGANICSARKLG
jgi:hypothetical protein